jgi:DNA-binding CsgD family transcriptional regulator
LANITGSLSWQNVQAENPFHTKPAPVDAPRAKCRDLRVVSDGSWNGTRLLNKNGIDVPLASCSGIYWELKKGEPKGRLLVVFDEQEIEADGAGTELMQAPKPPNPLTTRERAVLIGVCEGLKNDALARRLKIGAGTVKYHLRNIYTKLGVHDRVTLAILAVQRGLLDE